MLTQAGSSIENYSGGHPAKKESLKVFFLVLQVCHLLMAGQVSLILSKKWQSSLVRSFVRFPNILRLQRMMFLDYLSTHKPKMFLNFFFFFGV